MFTTIISHNKESITLQVTIEFSDSMMKSEDAILEALNEAGTYATEEALKQFGSPAQSSGV